MTAARVIPLDAYRRTQPLPAAAPTSHQPRRGKRPAGGTWARIAGSPAARDARRFRDDHDRVLAAGLLIALVLVLIWSLR